MKTDTVIVGGGLSGLWLAWQLEQLGHDYQLIDARGRFGGRIHSYPLNVGGKVEHFDLGPSWFWPGQERIQLLLQQLGLNYFEQYSDGELIYEDERGEVQLGLGYASMQGSYRLHGSLSALVNALEKNYLGIANKLIAGLHNSRTKA